MNTLLEQIIAMILILIGISMFTYWIGLYIIKNKKLNSGLRSVEKDVGLVIFHIIAELLAGILSIVAGIFLLLNISYALPLTFAVLGMHVYIGIRTLSWSILNNNKITPNLVFVTLFSIVSFFILVS